MGGSDGVNPVPKMIVSTGYSLPSASTTPFSVTDVSADDTISTSLRVIAGNQSLDNRIRLQVMAKSGVSRFRNSGSGTCLRRNERARFSNSGKA